MDTLRIRTITSEAELVGKVASILARTHKSVDVGEFIDFHDAEVILVDSESIKLIGAKYLSKTIVLSSQSDESNIGELVKSLGVDHVIGKNGGDVAGELVATIAKLNGGPIWGIEPYASNLDKQESVAVRSSLTFQGEVDRLIDDFNYSDFFNSPSEHLKIIANELVMNALYNATKDSLGNKLFVGQDRKIPVNAEKDVIFKVGMDSTGVFLSTQDNYGSLERASLVENLYRSFSTKQHLVRSGGAGLGLYLAYTNSNFFVVNSKAGERTEIICKIDKNRRYKNYKTRITSFHFHTEE